MLDSTQKRALMLKALRLIAELDPLTDSDEGYNEWGEADCFRQAQIIARSALVSTNNQEETSND